MHIGEAFTSGGGWSGSESEEDDFAQVFQSIISRKNSSGLPKPRRSASGPSTPSRSVRPPALMTPAILPIGQNRLSNLSNLSSGSSATTAYSTLLTPSTSQDSLVPIHIASGFTSDADSEDAYPILSPQPRLPRPTKLVAGWGEPEMWELAGAEKVRFGEVKRMSVTIVSKDRRRSSTATPRQMASPAPSVASQVVMVG